jgi:hypothetical protein
VPRGAPRTYDVDVVALDLDELEHRLRDAGNSANQVRGILAYTVLVQAGRKVEIPPPTVSRYRRLICEAYGIPPGPPPRIGKPKLASVTALRPRAQGGRSTVGTMVAGLAVSAAALAGAPGVHSEAPRSPSPELSHPAPIIPVTRRWKRSEGLRAA